MTVADEVGPVEFELMFSISAILFGVYGNEGMQKTIGQTFGIASGSPCPLHIFCEYQWNFLFGIVLCFM